MNRVWLPALITIGILASACSGEGSGLTTTECGADRSIGVVDPVSDLTIALVAPSPADDFSSTQSMVDALLRLGIEAKISDNTFAVSDGANAIRGYATDGVDVVIVHGALYGPELEQIAPDFPQTSFLFGSASDTLGQSNVYAYRPAAEQGGYVNGVLAALLSESGVVSAVGPVQAGDSFDYISGFEKGAFSKNGSVLAEYTGSFASVERANLVANAHIASGADVITGTAQHVTGPIDIVNQRDLAWIGNQVNHEELAPNVVVASQVYRWDVFLQQALAQIEAGKLGGEAYELTLENGGLVIELNGCYELSGSIKDEVVDTVKAIQDGELEVG